MILFCSLYTTSPWSHEKRRTGFGLATYGFAKALADQKQYRVNYLQIRESLHRRHELFVRKNFATAGIFEAICLKSVLPLSFLDNLKFRVFYALILNECRARKYDLIHTNGCNLFSLAAFFVAKKTDKPFLLSLHGLVWLQGKYGSRANMYVESFLLSHLSGENQKIICVSKNIEKAVLSFNANLRVEYLPNFVELDSIIERKPFKPDSFGSGQRKIISLVGNFSDRKNQGFAIKQFVASKVKNDFVLVIAGSLYGMSSEIKQMINQEPNIITLGSIEKSSVYQLYQDAHVNLVVAKSEGFGMSIIESLKFGTATVMFKDLDLYYELSNVTGIFGLERNSSQNIFTQLASLKLPSNISLPTCYTKDAVLLRYQRILEGICQY